MPPHVFEDTRPNPPETPAPAELPDGPVIGRYRVVSALGKGSVGEVHAAIDLVTGQPVALKTIRLGGTAGSDAREARRRFAVETEVLRELQHPAIVRVYACGSEGDLGWLAMELLGGCDLVRYTRASRRLPDGAVMRLAERLARGLAYAHALGVVHRDIKPANVMVDWAADRVTLTDFGIARLADAERTRTGLMVGSPAYMAPELLAGGAPSPASDLYALGVTLYQLLASRLPFDDSSMGELLRRVAHEPAPPLRSVDPAVPEALAAVVDRLLAKRPADRGEGAQALAGELHAMREAAAADGGGPMSRT